MRDISEPFFVDYGVGFISPAQATAAQWNTKAVGIKYDKRPHLSWRLVDCPSCGAKMAVRTEEADMHSLACTERHDPKIHPKTSIRNGHSATYSNSHVDRMLLIGLKEELQNGASNQAFLDEVTALEDARVKLVREQLIDLDRKIGENEARYQTNLRNAIDLRGRVSDSIADDALMLVEKIKQESLVLYERRDRLVATRRNRVSAKLGSEEDALGLAAVIDKLLTELPWRPTDESDLELFYHVRSMIGGAKIIENDDKSEDFEVTYVLAATSDGEPVVTKVRRFSNLHLKNAYINREGRVEDLLEEFDDFHGRLTDVEFEELPTLWPYQVENRDLARLMFDIALSTHPLGVPLYTLSNALGIDDNPIRDFKAAGGLKKLEKALRKRRGNEFKITLDLRVDKDKTERARLLLAEHPIMLLDIVNSSSGVTSLTLDQWQLIRDVLPTSQHPLPEWQMREGLEAYFEIVRTNGYLGDILKLEFNRHMGRRVRFPASRASSLQILSQLLPLQGYRLPDGFAMPEIDRKGIVGAFDEDAILHRIAKRLERIEPVPCPRAGRRGSVKVGELRFDLDDYRVMGDAGQTFELDRRERAIAVVLAEHRGTLMSSKELQWLVLGKWAPAGEIDSHFESLRLKLARTAPKASRYLAHERLFGFVEEDGQ